MTEMALCHITFSGQTNMESVYITTSGQFLFPCTIKTVVLMTPHDIIGKFELDDFRRICNIWEIHCERKCGNSKCNKDYMLDTVGTEEFPQTIAGLRAAIKFRKANKWKFCKGCKTTYYCSRKCQKISWKYGHRLQCKTLQKLVNGLVVTVSK